MESNEQNGTSLKNSRYYIRGSVMEVEEDITHEFKGHRNIAIEEIPPWCIDINDSNRKTRNCVSRNLCGFLNSTLGGTVYLGVLDNGEVEGLPLTRYQRDHIKICLNDTMQRFRPPVPKHLFSVKFVPCLEKSDITYQLIHHNQSTNSQAVEEYEKRNTLNSQCNTKSSVSTDLHSSNVHTAESNTNFGGWDWAVEQNCQVNFPKELKFKNDSLRKRPHTLQTYRYCWCDQDANVRANFGHKPPSYIVEIVIRPPSAMDPEIRKHLPPSSKLPIKPIFQAEDGNIYIRRHASLARRSLNDVVNEAVEDVQHWYYPILKDAEIRLGILQALVEKLESLKY